MTNSELHFALAFRISFFLVQVTDEFLFIKIFLFKEKSINVLLRTMRKKIDNGITLQKKSNNTFVFKILFGISQNRVNDTHREKLCFTRFSTRMAACLLLTFFICLHDQLSSIHSIITY